MKRTMLITLSAAMLATAACGQKSETAPEAVKAAFKQKFPDVKEAKWEKEHDNEWEADFKMGGKKYSASFKNDGTWIETEHEIGVADVPEAVKNTLDSEFDGYKVEESEMAETPSETVYEFELEKGKSEIEVAIGADGKVLKKEAEKEDGDEEGDDD